MHFHIYCNNKTVSAAHLEAIREYQKRLSSYCETSLSVDILPSIPDHVNIENCHIFILAIGISSFSSEEFAKIIMELQLSGKSHVCIYVGYNEKILYECLSVFLSKTVVRTFSLTGCSLASETLTVLLFEQLYRSYTILQGKTYHK